ncbi:MAG: hypothetical protein IJ719_21815 [Clostridia bacterium]|nr:hypothetical protein [Clostridia bacterium]
MKKLKQKLSFIDRLAVKHPKLAEILSVPEMRTDASLYIASGISFLFTLFCIISAFFQNTRWFLTLGLYNLILALVRMYPALVMHHEIQFPSPESERQEKEARVCFNVSLVLFSINLVLTGIIAETVIRNQAMHYRGILLNLLILFSGIRFLVLAIISIRKRREGATLQHAIRLINMTVAMCSVYTTQTAVLEMYCSDEIVRFLINLIASSFILYVLLRISINGMITSYRALHPEK